MFPRAAGRTPWCYHARGARSRAWGRKTPAVVAPTRDGCTTKGADSRPGQQKCGAVDVVALCRT